MGFWRRGSRLGGLWWRSKMEMIFFCVCVFVFGCFFMGKKDEFGRNNGLGCLMEIFFCFEVRMGRKWWVDGLLEGFF